MIKALKALYHWLNLTPRRIGLGAAIATLIGLLNFTAEISFDRSYRYGFTNLSDLFDELSGTWSLLVLVPFVIKFFSLYPLGRDTWLRRLPFYLLAMVLTGFMHTALMTLVRTGAYPLFGWGSYNPGELFYRFVMETTKSSPAFWTMYLIFVYYRSHQEKQARALQVASLKGELSEARLASLKNQLNPHFFFNTLNLISSVMYEDLKAADKLIADLGDFLRYSLRYEDVQEVTVREELDITQRYVDIMRSRFGDRLQVESDIAAGLEETKIPVFCLQPLVENSIKFGLDDPDRPCRIAIILQPKDDRRVIRVTDNGPGPGDHPKSGTKRGLHNIRERCRALYGEEASLELLPNPSGGAVAQLILP